MFLYPSGSNSSPAFSQDVYNLLIGPESEVKGVLHSQGSIRIEGVVEGEIRSQGEVVIGQGSRVTANIVAKRVIVSGEVSGNIEAIKGLKICGTGRVYGDIHGSTLMIEEGAIYRGRVNMDLIISENVYEGTKEIPLHSD